MKSGRQTPPLYNILAQDSFGFGGAQIKRWWWSTWVMRSWFWVTMASMLTRCIRRWGKWRFFPWINRLESSFPTNLNLVRLVSKIEIFMVTYIFRCNLRRLTIVVSDMMISRRTEFWFLLQWLRRLLRYKSRWVNIDSGAFVSSGDMLVMITLKLIELPSSCMLLPSWNPSEITWSRAEEYSNLVEANWNGNRWRTDKDNDSRLAITELN